MLTTASFSTLLPLSFLDISSSPPPFIPLTISPVLGCLFPGLSWHCWRSPGIPLQALHLLSRNNFLAKVSHPRGLNCNQSPNSSRISRFSPDPCSDLQTPGPVQGSTGHPEGTSFRDFKPNMSQTALTTYPPPEVRIQLHDLLTDHLVFSLILVAM